jgi:hypothetical protein
MGNTDSVMVPRLALRPLERKLKIAPDRIGKFSMKAAAKEGRKAVIKVALADVTAFHEGLHANVERSDKLENKLENLTDSDSQGKI